MQEVPILPSLDAKVNIKTSFKEKLAGTKTFKRPDGSYKKQQPPVFELKSSEFVDEKEMKEKIQERLLEKYQFEKPQDYIEELRFDIDLQKLYKVIDSCCYNLENEFSAVVIELNSEFIKKNQLTDKFLLQIWSKTGQMLFERNLKQNLVAWNFHKNRLLFQENNDGVGPFTIFMVIVSTTTESQLFEYRFQFEYNHDELVKDLNYDNQLSKEKQIEEEQNPKIDSVIPRTIGIGGSENKYLILSNSDRIYYTSIDNFKKGTPRGSLNQTELEFFQLQKECHLLTILDIGNDETALCIMNEINIPVFYRVKEFKKNQQNQVLLNLVKLGLKENNFENNYDDNIEQNQIIKSKKGSTQIQPQSQRKKLSPLSQMRFIVMLDQDKVYQDQLDQPAEENTQDIKKRKFTCLALILRKDGSFEFYSDWNLVSPKNNIEKQSTKEKKSKIVESANNMKGLEIENDNKNFYLRVKKDFKDFYETILFEISLSWGNLIGISVASKIYEKMNKKNLKKDKKDLQNEFNLHKEEQKKIDKILESVRHSRISSYFKIYTQFLNYHTYMLVSHRKYISVFDLRDKDCDILKTFEFDNKVQFIAESHQEDVLVLLEKNQTYKIDSNFNLELISLEINNRMIVSYCTDQINKSGGIYFITKKSEKFELFQVSNFQSIPIEYHKDIILTNESKIKVLSRLDESDQKNDNLEYVASLFISNQFESFAFTVFLNDENTLQTDIHQTYYHQKFIESNNQDEQDQDTIQNQNIVSKELYKSTQNDNQDIFIGVVNLDDSYFYCLCEQQKKPIKKYDFKKKQICIPKGASLSKQNKGLYVFDIQRILKESKIESYCLAPAIVGLSSQLDFSNVNGRVSYFTNFNQLSMLPFPHRNTINFLGMDDPKDYLIWREKDGFFSALHKNGALRVWAIGSGKFIGSQRVESIEDNILNERVIIKDLFNKFKIYEANTGLPLIGDTYYKQGFQNFQDYSLQLFVEKKKCLSKSGPVLNRAEYFSNSTGHSVNIVKEEHLDYQFIVLKHSSQMNNDSKLNVEVFRRFTHRLPTPKDVTEGNDLPTGNLPSLYLSQDALIMMEVIDRQIAIIYKPREINQNYNQRPIEWEKFHFISQYPTILQGIQPLPFLFDPKFENYVDIDFSKGQFVIKSCDLNNQNNNSIIPKSLLDLSVVQEPEQEEFSDDENQVIKQMKIINEDSVQQIARRIHFFRDGFLRIINSEGIDTIYNIKKQQIVAYSKRDNFDLQKNNLKHRHFILDNSVFGTDQILERLVNRCQNFKSDVEFAKFDLQYQQINPDKNFKKPNILNFLYKVDYKKNCFSAESSFTLLDWITVERILDDPLFNIDDIDRLQLIQLCFNIFPQSQTILHKIALDAMGKNENEQTAESIDITTQKLFVACRKGLEQSSSFKKRKPFEIPLLEDLNGDTVLDIALKEDAERSIIGSIKEIVEIIYPMKEDSIYKQNKEETKDVNIVNYFIGIKNRLSQWSEKYQDKFKNISDKKANMLNSQLAMTVLAYMQSYSYLHSSSSIYRSVIRSIQIALPNIGQYIDSRFIISQHMPHRTQHELKHIPPSWSVVYRQEYWSTQDKYTNESNTDSSKWVNQVYNTFEAQLWDQKKELQSNLFKNQGVQKNMIIRYFDVPQMHLNSSEGYNFLRAMKKAALQNEDIALDIYSKRTVQILINQHWERTYNWIIVVLFIPYFVMLMVFELWTNYTLQQNDGWSDQAGSQFQTILIIFCVYFLTIDLVQLLFMTSFDIWFFLKVTPLCLVLYNATYPDILNVANQSENPVIQANSLRFWQIQAFSGFFMWFRMLYYMRSFEHFSYFIRMLIAVLLKIRIFIIILAIVVLGFADTFYSLSIGQKFTDPIEVTDETTNQKTLQQNTYIKSYVNSLQYSYEIVLGSFDPTLGQRDSVSWIFYVLASVISMLILGNMLIEIVSQTYSDISDFKYLYVFKERVELICDWQSTLTVMKLIKNFFMVLLKPIFWLMKLTKYGIKIKQFFVKKAVWKKILDQCNLMVAAWEDPEDQDTTPDFVEDERVLTTDERIDTLKQNIIDMKKQLGLEPETPDQYSAVDNPINSIRNIDEKLQNFINKLGLKSNSNTQGLIPKAKPKEYINQVNIQQSEQQQIRSEKVQEKVIKYKQQQVFDWQTKRTGK